MRIAHETLPRERLRNRELLADIIEDRRCDPSLFFTVLQEEGRAEVLFLGQYRSRSAATEAALQFMADWKRSEAG